MVRMAYSTTGCSPSATILRPRTDALDGCCCLDKLLACYGVSLAEVEYQVDKYRVAMVLPEWVQSLPFGGRHALNAMLNNRYDAEGL